jgi:hypothetical protein
MRDPDLLHCISGGFRDPMPRRRITAGFRLRRAFASRKRTLILAVDLCFMANPCIKLLSLGHFHGLKSRSTAAPGVKGSRENLLTQRSIRETLAPYTGGGPPAIAMDRQTVEFYNAHSAKTAQRYAEAPSRIARFFPIAFPPSTRILDLGCGSGQDLKELLQAGYEAVGIDASERMIQEAVSRFPRLAGKVTLDHLGSPEARYRSHSN